MSLMILTGLSEILLPVEDYDCVEAISTVKQLQEQNIPLIPVINNTRAEVEAVSQTLGFNSAFVVEQGSGIFIPKNSQDFAIAQSESVEAVDGYNLYQLGCTYTEARAALKVVQEEISKILRGFGDLDEENVQKLMGVSLTAARRAKSREFSEYFLTPSRLQISKLQSVAQEYGFQIIPEGKLSLVMGAGAAKGKAVTWLKENYRSRNSGKVTTVGLGSTKQDLPLLEAVDIPIIVPTALGIDSSLESHGWQTASHTGAKGWVKAIAKII